jgi:hypothetical protein
MIEAAICRTTHDDDAPASKDRFGVHARIARTIAQVIEQTSGGKMIGLSGTWGAGKSTVVRLLQDICTNSGNGTVVWTFDAWAHEGDPLRRTFLESLVTSLAAHRWLASTDWQRDLEVVARRRKWSQRRQAPRLTPMGVLLGISLLLVPIGSAIFANQVRNGITIDPAGTVDWLAATGLVLMLAPVVAPLLGAGLWLLFLTVTGRRREGSLTQQLLDAVSVFVQRGDTDLHTDTLESGDQTTLEFERLFAAIMRTALEADPSRRLVVVIDNLDRVGATQALAMWATLQTFLQRRGSGGWIEQLWCLIPYDADAMRRLWQKETPGTTIVDSFLDKTFQLRFDVPLPRLANWKDYLLERLACALPENHGQDEFFRIYRLYSVRRTADWTAPTPRQLKLFVNQIGSLHRQWQHEIPLVDLAYYALLQNEGTPIVPGLLAGNLPTPAETGLLSDRVRLNLAALAYGAEVEESHELLLRQPILDALEAGASDRLTELARVSDKFWLVLELAVEQGCREWPQAEGGLVLHATAALDGTSIVMADAGRAAGLMYRLRIAVRATSGWGTMDARAIDGAIVLARQDPTLGLLLHESFTRTRLGDGKMPAETAAEFARDYVRLTTAVSVSPAAPRRIADAGTYIDIAKTLASADSDGATWAHFAPQDESALITLLGNTRPPGWGDVVRVATHAGIRNWDSVVAGADEAFLKSGGAEQLEFLTAVHALANVGETAAAKLLDTVTDIYGAASNFTRDEEHSLPLALAAVGEHKSVDDISSPADPESLGAWLFTLLTRHTSSIALRHSRSSFTPARETARQWLDREYSRGAPEIADLLAQATLRLGSARHLLKLAQQRTIYSAPSDRMMVMQVLMALAGMGAPPRVLPPSLLIDEWDTAFPGWSRYELGRAMRSRRADIVDALVRIPFEAGLADAYAGVLDSHPSGDEALQSSCASGLVAVPAETWLAALRGGRTGLPLLHAALTRRGLSIVLAPDVKLALRELVTAPPDTLWMPADVAAAIMAIFDPSERQAVLDTIIEDLVAEADRLSLSGQSDYPARAFSHGARIRAVLAGRALFDPVRISASRHAFPALAAFALDHPGDEWTGWLYELTRKEPGLMRRLTGDARLSLQKLVEHQKARRASDQTRAWLIGLAEQLADVPAEGAADVQAI